MATTHRSNGRSGTPSTPILRHRPRQRCRRCLDGRASISIMPFAIPRAPVSATFQASLLALLLTVVSCAASGTASEKSEGARAADHAATSTERGPWLEYADVRHAGFDPDALRA